MKKKPIIPPDWIVKYDKWHFSPAVESGEFLFNVTLPVGVYTIVEDVDELADLDRLDGKETAGVNGGAVDNSQDSNEITDITISGDGTASENTSYLFAEIRPSDIQGMVWEDFNDDGTVNFGEKAIEGVTVILAGSDDRENAVGPIAAGIDGAGTDADGMYMFVDLRSNALPKNRTNIK